MKSTVKLPLLGTFAAVFCALLCVCGGAVSYTNTPVADSFVATGPTGNLSGDNFGAAGSLAVASSALPNGEFQSVIQYDLAAARTALDSQFGAGQWTITSVGLQLTSSPHGNPIFNSVAPGQFKISLMQNNSWVEGTGTGGIPTTDGISFNSLQSTFINNAADQDLGTFAFPGGSSGQNNYALALASGLGADILNGDHLSLRLSAADAQVSYLFNSRTVADATQPELIVTAVPEAASLALLAVGLGTLLCWHRRKCVERARPAGQGHQ